MNRRKTREKGRRTGRGRKGYRKDERDGWITESRETEGKEKEQEVTGSLE